LGLAFGFWLWLLRTEGWATLAGMLTLLAYLLIWHPDPVYIALAAANTLLLIWRYRDYLQKKPILFGRTPHSR
jgi:asparagine N-glycosylation enzyme membrane subunit Stt3